MIRARRPSALDILDDEDQVSTKAIRYNYHQKNSSKGLQFPLTPQSPAPVFNTGLKDFSAISLLASNKSTTSSPALPNFVISESQKEIKDGVFKDIKRVWFPLTPPSSVPEVKVQLPIPSPSIERPLAAENHTVAVIGCGYVGEHLVDTFSVVYPVIAFDISPARCEYINQTYGDRKVQGTTDKEALRNATAFLVSVPTLIGDDNKVDKRHLMAAIKTVSEYARPGSVVVIESSVAVGTTRTLMMELTETHGLYCGMSPERVDPGRTEPSHREIPKVISALDNQAMEEVKRLYGPIFDRTVPVSSPEVAEMCKLFENCYRMVNITFANEMADACQLTGINPMEVVSASGTKPFGFQAFTPSLGIGGHCIPVNPFYLFDSYGQDPSVFPLLRNATNITAFRPKKMAHELMAAICSTRKPENIRVLIVGAAFKPGVDTLCHSPHLSFARELKAFEGISVEYCDPFVLQKDVEDIKKFDEADWNKDSLSKSFDIITVGMRQHGLDFAVFDGLTDTEIVWYCN